MSYPREPSDTNWSSRIDPAFVDHPTSLYPSLPYHHRGARSSCLSSIHHSHLVLHISYSVFGPHISAGGNGEPKIAWDASLRRLPFRPNIQTGTEKSRRHRVRLANSNLEGAPTRSTDHLIERQEIGKYVRMGHLKRNGLGLSQDLPGRLS